MALNKPYQNLEFNEGYDAYLDGIETSPYEEGTMEAVDWFVGWMTARDECKVAA